MLRSGARSRGCGKDGVLSDYINLNEVEFYGFHGVLPAERSLGQRYLVDVEIRADLQAAGQLDDIDHTLNYVEVYRVVEQVLTGPSVQLIETLAERIAATLLGDFAQAESVVVRVRKPNPPIAGARIASSEVWIERERPTTPE